MSSDNKLFMLVGIPGSGKTTLAKKLAHLQHSAVSLSCSDVLRAVMKGDGIQTWSAFDDLAKNERITLLSRVTEELKNMKMRHKSIYADAHMLVKNRGSDELEVALSEADAAILDGLIFLDTSPEMILKNTQADNDSNVRERPSVSIDQVQAHRRKELEAAQAYSEMYRVPLHIVTNKNNDYSVEDLLERLSNTAALVPATEGSLQKQISSHLERIGSQVGSALVLDGDRTFSDSDAFRVFDTALGLRDSNRQAFEEHGYSHHSLMAVSENWRQVSIYEHLETLEKVATEIQPRSEWLEVISDIPKSLPVFLVTAGVPQLWQSILNTHQLDYIKVIGGTHPYLDRELITQDSKAEVISLLKQKGYWVAAAGDSPIDALMLNEADLAIVVPDSKGSIPLINGLDRQKEWFYLALEGYKEKANAMAPAAINSILLEKMKFVQHPYLKQVSGREIANAHQRSKVRGSSRIAIKAEHKKIGALFLDTLSANNPSFSPSDTVVIGIERSGRYLAEGAADFFDCSLLSAYQEHTASSSSQCSQIDTAIHGVRFIIPHLYVNQAHTVIYDSVIHTGGTIERVLNGLPENPMGEIHIFCTEINEVSLQTIKRLSHRASFYCLRISNRKDKPTGGDDMGAKLYGTAS